MQTKFEFTVCHGGAVTEGTAEDHAIIDLRQ